MLERWASLSKEWIHDQIDQIYRPVENKLDQTEDLIQSFFSDESREDIRAASEYLASAGGKRVRPALVLLFAELSGNIDDGYNYVHSAAAVEYIHNATLIHDDVVDEAELRRGVPSLNENWNNKTAVLVGDYLYSRALDEIANLGRWEVVGELTRATRAMSRGELISLNDQRNFNITREQYIEIIDHKTASLMSAACFTGASGCDKSRRQAALTYGREFGLAFQIIDDIIDLLSGSETAGKNAFKDLEKGKLTLPIIEAMSVSENGAREQVESLMQNHSTMKELKGDLVSVIEENNGFQQAACKAEEHARNARKALEEFEENPARESLNDMCDYVVNRNF